MKKCDIATPLSLSFLLLLLSSLSPHPLPLSLSALLRVSQLKHCTLGAQGQHEQPRKPPERDATIQGNHDVVSISCHAQRGDEDSLGFCLAQRPEAGLVLG